MFSWCLFGSVLKLCVFAHFWVGTDWGLYVCIYMYIYITNGRVRIPAGIEGNYTDLCVGLYITNTYRYR